MAQPLNIKVSTIFSKATYDAEVSARTQQGSEISQSIQSEIENRQSDVKGINERISREEFTRDEIISRLKAKIKELTFQFDEKELAEITQMVTELEEAFDGFVKDIVPKVEELEAKERTRHETEEMLLSTYTSNENWHHPGVWAHPVFLSEDNVREDAETKWSFLADARWSCCSSSEQKGRGCMMREPK